ncbi:unnamed protein product (macronuclear) [Paramecium tetraurelia]|uniref:Myb-like DNA-binding domain containing protein n=1 Tax=Paramecium tetraurelia TaxID=5888 RepID=A0CBB6_PARTE|nr:uncharacterized protein GSPATT00036866001 [Paramecium tetraurelia]CAK68083.1 unnamed protein product [Paramecium tetraurelia]|eukprot:XP_001435480.1 hypothetical protein (macronuclear) [Paramecium tetraurelia strain d4-2]
MEGLASTTDSIQANCKFVTRLEKLKKLFDQSLQKKQENIIFQNRQVEIPQWVDLLNSYKEIEKEHNEFNLNNVGKMKKMDQSEIDLLNVVVRLYGDIHKLQPLLMDVFDWDQIGSILFNRHWKVCRSKWMENQATSIVDHPWSREEDAILSQLYEKYAEQNKYNKWSLIAMEMSKICKSSHVRLGKQCRERWINKLNPQVERGPWYKEEEIKLLVAVLNNGKKWSLISRRDFDNQRTENCLKNRFHTIIKRESSKFDKHKTQNKKQNLQKINLEDENKLIEQIIQELKDESFLQQQSDLWNTVSKKYHISQSDHLLDIIDNSFQVVIIKKNKINEIF